ncbi:MAG TPA: aminoglycoside phosphotransferase family protein [Planctomycetaceae bacterium]
MVGAPSRRKDSGDDAASPVRLVGLYSVVAREKRAQGTVYVKHYLPGPFRAEDSVLEKRCAREADVIRRLPDVPHLRGRLGRLELVEHEPARLRLVTKEAAGVALQQALVGSRPDRRPGIAKALILAGRWIRAFQELPVARGDDSPIGDIDPPDLLDYCDIRLRNLRERGYRWLNEARRSEILAAVARLRGEADEDDRRRVWSHRDYHPGNVLWDGKAVTAIDFAMAGLDVPLADVTYFIHRLEMQRVYRPWRRRPTRRWKRAFLRGYGRPDAESAAMYRLLMIRHLICRLLTYATRPPRDSVQHAHNIYVRAVVRSKLMRLCRP